MAEQESYCRLTNAFIDALLAVQDLDPQALTDAQVEEINRHHKALMKGVAGINDAIFVGRSRALKEALEAIEQCKPTLAKTNRALHMAYELYQEEPWWLFAETAYDEKHGYHITVHARYGTQRPTFSSVGGVPVKWHQNVVDGNDSGPPQ